MPPNIVPGAPQSPLSNNQPPASTVQPKAKWPWWVKLLIGIVVTAVLIGVVFFGALTLVSLDGARGLVQENEAIINHVKAATIVVEDMGSDYSGICQNQTVVQELGLAAEASTGDSSRFGCYASQTKYMFVSPLKTNNYYCLDSMGGRGTFSEASEDANSCADFPGFKQE